MSSDSNIVSNIISYGITGVAVVTAAVYGGLNALKNRREDRKAQSTTIVPATWPEVWSRMEALEKKNIALINVFEDLVRQWPTGTPRPTFDKADIAVLADTIPSEWLHS